MTILDLADSEISHCSFDDIEIGENSYLCDGTGATLIEYCNFSNIRTDGDIEDIFHCEETRGKVLKRKVQFSIIDEETCTGLY